MDKERKPLVIEAQGTFNAGGRVVKGKGTFDPMNPESPYIVPEDPFSYPDNGQSLHGDNAHVLYQDASASASPKYVKFYTFS